MASRAQKIIIGIDFGTTYSGVAWTDTSSVNPEVLPIREWPDATGNQDMDKVPSEILYPHDPSAPAQWGFETNGIGTAGGTVLQYMKLLLDPAQEKKSTMQLAHPLGLVQMRAAIPRGKAPVDVVTDYLCCIKAHALSMLSKSLGQEFWKRIPVQYRLTIPAVWSEAAKSLTLQAAHRAGIGSEEDLVLIAEPEAAALYCLTEIYKDLLKVGDTFVVADCGGGTVDLISYQILDRNPKLRVKELAVGGGLCGSVFLNRRFESFVRRRIGNEMVDDMMNRGRPVGRPYKRMMKDFEERLKRNFKDSPDQEVMDCFVGGADDRAKRVMDGHLEITRNEMKGVFDPVINEIIRLVRQQIDTVSRDSKQRVSTVLIVGGFGASPYLQQRLINEIDAHYGNGISVLQPKNAWSAVVRGAVISGLQNIEISSRKAQRSYGVKCRKTWEAGDQFKYKDWCPYSEEYKCNNRIQWYVKQGAEVSDTTEIAMPFHCLFPVNGPLKTTNVLLASDSPPTNLERNALHHNVYVIRPLETDLSRLQNKLVRSTNSKGQSFYDVYYELVMKIHSAAQLTFELRYNGVTYGDAVTAPFK